MLLHILASVIKNDNYNIKKIINNLFFRTSRRRFVVSRSSGGRTGVVSPLGPFPELGRPKASSTMLAEKSTVIHGTVMYQQFVVNHFRRFFVVFFVGFSHPLYQADLVKMLLKMLGYEKIWKKSL
jgi:hypothetical protein